MYCKQKSQQVQMAIDVVTFPLQRTSSAALRTPPQASLSHGLRALVVKMMVMMRMRMVVTTMVMMMRMTRMKYQSSLW